MSTKRLYYSQKSVKENKSLRNTWNPLVILIINKTYLSGAVIHYISSSNWILLTFFPSFINFKFHNILGNNTTLIITQMGQPPFCVFITISLFHHVSHYIFCALTSQMACLPYYIYFFYI